ncbi:hypothetical protein GCM10008983_25100 [Lentibacillus halophilus]|uniref:Uncharacterized protein n=1 Tax=Lentibacillus halophilus TaxID=295065 RepID=A0ABN0ZG62_9BACI
MLEELDSLWNELNKTYIYIFIALMALYTIIRPMIKWAVMVKTTKFLNYILSSLLLLVLILSGIVLTAFLDKMILAVVLNCLALFGLMLIVIHTVEYLFRNRKKRV